MTNVLKVYFAFEFKDTPHGGAFQFTKALRNYLDSKGMVVEEPELADIIYVSASHFYKSVLKLKYKYPGKIFVHRIDGPIRLYNHMNDERDNIVNWINKNIADATIFQSNWSKVNSKKMGLTSKSLEATIINAPDPTIFNSSEISVRRNERSRKKIIATSWSANLNKGYDIYKWMDTNLDFNKFEMVFVGNSPIKFTNIITLPPKSSFSLSSELKDSDIYITASKNDPCSNSLIEALHCGLPAIALNSGGHPEIVGRGGLTFDDENDIPRLIQTILSNHESFKRNISLPDMFQVGQLYSDFFMKVYIERKGQPYTKISMLTCIWFFMKIQFWKSKRKLNI